MLKLCFLIIVVQQDQPWDQARHTVDEGDRRQREVDGQSL
jgi:hypothetical protein